MEELAAQERHSLAIGPFGSDLKTTDYCNAGVPIIFVRDIQPGCFRAKDRKYVSGPKAASLAAHTVRPGDLLITKMGTPPCVAAVYPDTEPPGIVTADIIKLTIDPTIVDRDYLARFLNTDLARRQVAGITFGITRPKVTLRDFRTMRIPLPPLHEQKRIAAILDKADALRRKRREAIAKLDTLMRSVFLEMFGDPATNSMKWPEYRLGDTASAFSDGPFGSNLKSSHYVASGVRVIRLQNIGVGELIDTDRAYVSEAHYVSLPRHHCLPGDVLIGTLGDPNLRACILPSHIPEALNKADCVQLRPDPTIATGEFLCALLNLPSTLSMAMCMIHGQTRLRISMGKLRDLRVPVPPIGLQHRFSEVVRKLYDVRRVLHADSDKLDTLFRSLQRDTFDGKPACLADVESLTHSDHTI